LPCSTPKRARPAGTTSIQARQLAGYTAWEIGQLPLRRNHRSAASSAAPVASRIVMGVTMALMLLIMV
jgi:hypothetical protein